MSTYATVDPRTGAELATYELMADSAIRDAIDLAAQAYEAWSREPIGVRSDVLQRVAELHRERRADLAHAMSREMGKPVTQALGEIDLSASIYEYYAQKGPDLLRDEELDVAGGGRALVRTAPIGAVLGIMPWNFPLYQTARFAAPALLLGNTVVLKQARACTQTGLQLEQIVLEAASTPGVYRNLLVSSGQIAAVIADERVRGVTFTGSEEAGRSVAALAGQHLKKTVLELGGSDPFIVLEDADLEIAVTMAESRFNNAGQSCTSAKRMIVHSSVWDEFVASFVDRARDWVAGDPLDEATRLGPMASTAGRAELAEQVDDAVAKGATVHVGAHVPEGEGAYYPATVISGVTPGMRAYDEELFGPVAVLYRVDSTDEAVRLANDSRFGLAASVYSRDPEAANSVADRLDAGMVGLNTVIRSQPGLPFGGVKASGIGRELGRFGLDEFANKKLIRIA
jgi:acyl-CoA reductase-like NAD-dependent aldehyde dehydrogenase